MSPGFAMVQGGLVFGKKECSWLHQHSDFVSGLQNVPYFHVQDSIYSQQAVLPASTREPGSVQGRMVVMVIQNVKHSGITGSR
jgi:hypothetical protein